MTQPTREPQTRPPSVREALTLTPAERMARFERLQREAFALLTASPDGYRRFWQRNLHQRSVHARG
jgi:hypothetical protein